MSEARTAQPGGDLHNYVLVTAAYWADTIADGAIRLLVLFYFYERGYTPLQLAPVFALYEVFGIITNLVGGFLAARFGPTTTLILGLVTTLAALLLLGVVPDHGLVVPSVPVAHAQMGGHAPALLPNLGRPRGAADAHAGDWTVAVAVAGNAPQVVAAHRPRASSVWARGHGWTGRT